MSARLMIKDGLFWRVDENVRKAHSSVKQIILFLYFSINSLPYIAVEDEA